MSPKRQYQNLYPSASYLYIPSLIFYPGRLYSRPRSLYFGIFALLHPLEHWAIVKIKNHSTVNIPISLKQNPKIPKNSLFG
jgi:hypothetical protein